MARLDDLALGIDDGEPEPVGLAQEHRLAGISIRQQAQKWRAVCAVAFEERGQIARTASMRLKPATFARTLANCALVRSLTFAILAMLGIGLLAWDDHLSRVDGVVSLRSARQRHRGPLRR